MRTKEKGANMKKNNKGFGAIEILLVIVVIGLVVAVGWLFFDRQKDTKNNEVALTNSEQAKKTQESKGTEEQPKGAAKISIYPNDQTRGGKTFKDLFFTVQLPSGWSVQKVYENYNIVKSVGNDKYLISSSIEKDASSDKYNRNLMEQRVAEGIETVASVKTGSGTNVSVLKTPTVLFVSSCKPTGENCYLQLSGKSLYIHLYKVIPGAQSLINADYPQEIINDFTNIAKSLSI
ncbi:hypothetical protein KBD87_01670 [Candidatus Saccharibacteria bacterium]|jgi:type II secretory pathway pseudopilin PulG|nr:hypothetical protein [Candidatus Saccharibacteria bacterium]